MPNASTLDVAFLESLPALGILLALMASIRTSTASTALIEPKARAAEFSKLGSRLLVYLIKIGIALLSLNFPIVHLNTPFRKRVLEAERNIPYGQTRSYREVAQMVASPRAFRAVGSANASNPLPLYFPCHRIINSNGRLGGFGWGDDVKQYLLDLESKSL